MMGIVRALFPTAEMQKIEAEDTTTELQRVEKTLDAIAEMFSDSENTWRWDVRDNPSESERMPSCATLHVRFFKKGLDLPSEDTLLQPEHLFTFTLAQRHYGAQLPSKGGAEALYTWWWARIKEIEQISTQLSLNDLEILARRALPSSCKYISEEVISINGENANRSTIIELIKQLAGSINLLHQDDMQRTLGCILGYKLTEFYPFAANILDRIPADDPHTICNLLPIFLREEGTLTDATKTYPKRIQRRLQETFELLKDKKIIFPCLEATEHQSVYLFLTGFLADQQLTREEAFDLLCKVNNNNVDEASLEKLFRHISHHFESEEDQAAFRAYMETDGEDGYGTKFFQFVDWSSNSMFKLLHRLGFITDESLMPPAHHGRFPMYISAVTSYHPQKVEKAITAAKIMQNLRQQDPHAYKRMVCHAANADYEIYDALNPEKYHERLEELFSRIPLTREEIVACLFFQGNFDEELRHHNNGSHTLEKVRRFKITKDEVESFARNNQTENPLQDMFLFGQKHSERFELAKALGYTLHDRNYRKFFVEHLKSIFVWGNFIQTLDEFLLYAEFSAEEFLDSGTLNEVCETFDLRCVDKLENLATFFKRLQISAEAVARKMDATLRHKFLCYYIEQHPYYETIQILHTTFGMTKEELIATGALGTRNSDDVPYYVSSWDKQNLFQFMEEMGIQFDDLPNLKIFKERLRSYIHTLPQSKRNDSWQVSLRNMGKSIMQKLGQLKQTHGLRKEHILEMGLLSDVREMHIMRILELFGITGDEFYRATSDKQYQDVIFHTLEVMHFTRCGLEEGGPRLKVCIRQLGLTKHSFRHSGVKREMKSICDMIAPTNSDAFLMELENLLPDAP